MNLISENYLRYADSAAGQLNVVSATYARGGGGARISYTITRSGFGFILIAATAHGLCWIGVHECVTYLESELRKDFAGATIMRDDLAMAEAAERVIAFVSDGAGSLDLPVDIRASAFQLAVWRELCAIPRGATRSYSEIARRLGHPRGARAVGRANGSNPLALLIPCHRAVGANGELTGYRWGLEYKRRLLEHERCFSAYRPSTIDNERCASGE
jgi:AraC family transcriptional regulator, regulatory protein of adaptative response / methylated-DNA-[protein]-cysteine methyltransferase